MGSEMCIRDRFYALVCGPCVMGPSHPVSCSSGEFVCACAYTCLPLHGLSDGNLSRMKGHASNPSLRTEKCIYLPD